MKNLALFVLTVAGWFGAWWYIGGTPEGAGEYLFRLGILAFLSVPFNINGNIWTVLGNAESEGSIYSFFPLYQKARRRAGTIVGVLSYQDAKEIAYIMFGFLTWQEAADVAAVGIGFTLCQKARYEICLGTGIALYQGLYSTSVVDKTRSVRTVIGFAVYQTDSSGSNVTMNSRMFGVFSKFPVYS